MTVGAAQTAEAAKALDQFTSQINRTFANHASTQENRDQFGVCERRRALLQQFFPWTRVLRPVANRHIYPC